MQTRLRRLAGLLGLAGLVLAACSPSGAGPSSDKQSAERPPSFFYRMKAEFVLKETGEPIRFDYVVGCGGVVMGNAGTSPMVFYEHHPMIMFQPVGNGHVLGLVTIDMCEDWKWGEVQVGPRRGESRIPDDLRPLAIWIEDINDLSFGWGYKTDDAYESPLAKIEFVEASVTKTDEAAWRAWRQKAAADYEQIGALPGPWGYNYSNETPQRQKEVNSRGNGFGILFGECFAQSQIRVPEVIINSALDEVGAPSDRYYVSLENQSRLFDVISSKLKERSDRLPLSAYFNGEIWFYGTLTRQGGGHITWPGGSDEWGLAYRPVYPLLPRSIYMSDINSPQDTYARGIDTSPKRLGFGACRSNQRPLDSLYKVHPKMDGDLYPNPFDSQAESKRHEFYIADDLVGLDPSWQRQSPVTVFDRQGYVYLPER